MCQPKNKGGRRCPAHQPGYLGLKLYITHALGLDEGQIKYSYDSLRNKGKRYAAPTLEEYEAFVNKTNQHIIDSNLDTKTKRRIQRQLGKPLNEKQLPDGATFHAMQSLIDVSKRQQRDLNRRLAKLGISQGKSSDEIQNEFRKVLSGVVTQKKKGTGVLDDRSRIALAILENQQTPRREEHPRIELAPTNSKTIPLAGYDPEDGRLEVEVNGKKYAYRDVSQDDWKAFNHYPVKTLKIINAQESHHYSSLAEAEADAYRIWCDKCKRFHVASRQNQPCMQDVISLYEDMAQNIQGSNRPLHIPNWYKAWEKRPHEDLGKNPSPETVRDLANSMKIGEMTLVFTDKDGSKISAEVSVGKAKPEDITLKLNNPPRCTCEQYQKNHECEHISNKFMRTIRSYYAKVDADSARRNPDLEFPYQAYGSEGVVNFTADQNGLTQEQLNDIAYVCDKGGSALVYLNYKEMQGEGNALGAFIFRKNEADINYHIQATCSICHRSDCYHLKGLAERQAKKIQNKLLTPAYRMQKLSEMQPITPPIRGNTAPRNTPRYSDDLPAYLSDYKEALDKIHQGISPIEFKTESVTQGNISPITGEGRGFGVEIEYVVDDERQREAIQDEIAEALVQSGLSNENYPFTYGSSSRFTKYQVWAVEDDASVSGEVISPILYDNKESWEQIQMVCDIIKKHGGKVDASCGQHVHIGTQQPRASTNIGVLNFVQSHQDSMRRIGTNPDVQEHRNNIYSLPFQEEDIQTLLYGIEHKIDDPTLRDHMVNFLNDKTIEFRDADGSLNPAHIQAQVMMASAIVNKAERGELEEINTSSQNVGINRKRTQLLTGGELKDLSDETLIVSDIAYRNTIDSLFDDDYSKKTMVGLAAMNPWQQGPS